MAVTNDQLEVTLLYFNNDDACLHNQTLKLPINETGRPIIPTELRSNKQIVGVVEGRCQLVSTAD